MSWIIIRYHPGFAEDLTSWETRIAPDGALIQIVEVARFSPERERRTDRYSAQLSPEQLSELSSLIAAVDFAEINAVVDRIVCSDTDSCVVTVQQGEEIASFGAPLEWWPYLQKAGIAPPFNIIPALRLWYTLDGLSPYGLHLRYKARNSE